jgi:hypothetical protein
MWGLAFRPQAWLAIHVLCNLPLKEGEGTHPVQTEILYFLEHEGYLAVDFAFNIGSVFRMYFAEKIF